MKVFQIGAMHAYVLLILVSLKPLKYFFGIPHKFNSHICRTQRHDKKFIGMDILCMVIRKPQSHFL